MIYVLKESNSEVVRYVGITQNYQKRFKQHLATSKNKKTRKQKWISSLINNGLTPDIEIIDSQLTSEEAGTKEMQYILLYKAMGAILVNGTRGGEGTVVYEKSEYGKKLISERHKGHTYNRGRTHTEESRKNMSDAHKGYVMPEEQKRKISISGTGLKRSDECKRKIGLAHLGMKHSLIAKQRISETRKARFLSGEIVHQMIGIKMSDEHKEKLRLINSTRIISKEVREKQRKSAFVGWEKRRLNKKIIC